MAEIELAREDGTPVCTARVAATFSARLVGLLATARLPQGRGMLFPRTSSVHTHFMRFPIDVVFLDSARRIVAIRDPLPPWRFARARDADAVLELAAGECRRLQLAVGDVLVER